VREHAGLVYAVARRQGLREAECDDVVQSVFVTLLKHLDAIEEAAKLPGWLATTARRESWRIARRVARGGAALEADHPLASPISGDALERIELADRVRRGLEALGPKCRDLLTALFLETDHPDYERVSQRVGIPFGSIGPTRARCLAKLAEILAAEEGGSSRNDIERGNPPISRYHGGS